MVIMLDPQFHQKEEMTRQSNGYACNVIGFRVRCWRAVAFHPRWHCLRGAMMSRRRDMRRTAMCHSSTINERVCAHVAMIPYVCIYMLLFSLMPIRDPKSTHSAATRLDPLQMYVHVSSPACCLDHDTQPCHPTCGHVSPRSLHHLN